MRGQSSSGHIIKWDFTYVMEGQYEGHQRGMFNLKLIGHREAVNTWEAEIKNTMENL